MRLNKTIKASLLCVGALALSVGAGVGLKHSGLVRADTLRVDYARSKEYQANVIMGYHSGVDAIDYLSPMTINGQWVWCIEPMINTDTGKSYSTNTPVEAGLRLRTKPGQSLSSGHFEKWSNPGDKDFNNIASANMAAVTPWILLKADLNELEKLKVFSSKTSPNRIAFLKYFRSLPSDDQWALIQFQYWRIVAGWDVRSTLRDSVTIGDVTYTTGSYPKYIRDLWESAVPMNLRVWGANLGGLTEENAARVTEQMYRLAADIMTLYNEGQIEYVAGSARAYIGDVATINRITGNTQTLIGSGGEFKVKPKGYLQVHKDVQQLKAAYALDGKTYTFNVQGLKFGVYKDEGGSDKVADLTLGQDGNSNKVELDQGTYYVYELDLNGNPIKSKAQDVNQNPTGDRAYVSGAANGQEGSFRASVNVTADNKENNPAMGNFTNVMTTGSFNIHKVMATPGWNAAGLTNPQGAIYDLYDKNKQPVKRNGQQVSAVVDANGVAKFENLPIAEGTYYVKERQAPTGHIGGSFQFFVNDTFHEIRMNLSGASTAVENDATDISTIEYTVNQVNTAPIDTEKPKSAVPPKFKKQSGSGTGDLPANSEDQPDDGSTYRDAEFEVTVYDAKGEGKSDRAETFSNEAGKLNMKSDNNGRVDVGNRSQITSIIGDQNYWNGVYQEWDQNNVFPLYRYHIIEKASPDGYLWSDQALDINGDEIEQVEDRPDYDKDDKYFKFSTKDKAFRNEKVQFRILKTEAVDNTAIWGFKPVLTEDQAKNSPIQGLTFSVEGPKRYDGKAWPDVTTNQNGEIVISGAIDGDYYLTEKNAETKGYRKDGRRIHVTVSKVAVPGKDAMTHKVTAVEPIAATENKGDVKAAVQAIDDNNASGLKTWIQNNTTPSSVQLTKTNEKGQRLAGAEFKLVQVKDDGTEELVDTLTTDGNGQLSFSADKYKDQLFNGNVYYLYESKAPKGYKLPRVQDRIVFKTYVVPSKNQYSIAVRKDTVDRTIDGTVQGGGDGVAVNSTDGKNKNQAVNWKWTTGQISELNAGQTKDGVTLKKIGEGQVSVEITMNNQTFDKLPITGSNTMIWIGSIVISVMVIGGVIAIRVRRADDFE